MTFWFDSGKLTATQIWDIENSLSVEEAIEKALKMEQLSSIPYDQRKRWEEGFRSEWNDLIIEAEIEMNICQFN